MLSQVSGVTAATAVLGIGRGKGKKGNTDVHNAGAMQVLQKIAPLVVAID